MKLGILLLTICSATTVIGQKLNCQEIRNGVFQFPGFIKDVYTIIRTDSIQFERSTKYAKHSYMKIKWVNDCQYTLSERTEYYRGKAPKIDTTNEISYNTVYKFEKPNKYYVKTYYSNYSDTIETIMTKIDTTKCYNNLFQLSEFAEFKNSKIYGQTLLGEIHSIDYYESNITANKYVITFETTYQGEKLNKSRLLDSKIIYLKAKQAITNSKCRFNGEFDDEIVAVYASSDDDKEAKIIKAFRCNRQTEKMEPLNIKLVQFKIKDRNRIKGK